MKDNANGPLLDLNKSLTNIPLFTGANSLHIGCLLQALNNGMISFLYVYLSSAFKTDKNLQIGQKPKQ